MTTEARPERRESPREERRQTARYERRQQLPPWAIFSRTTRATRKMFAGIGKRAYYGRDMIRALGEPGTWGSETLRQMMGIGVESLPLVLIVAGFLGAVAAFQSYYQLFAGVQLSVLGLLVRGSIVLELGPLLTSLVLAGRVGARMTAEIGTMRVTAQIDALETLAYDPVAVHAGPRVLTGRGLLPAAGSPAASTFEANAAARRLSLRNTGKDTFSTLGKMAQGLIDAATKMERDALGMGAEPGRNDPSAPGASANTQRPVEDVLPLMGQAALEEFALAAQRAMMMRPVVRTIEGRPEPR